jgi:signal transduction histidine kinase
MNLYATPEPLPRLARWAFFGVYAALTAFGVAYELPHNAVLVWTAGACAVIVGAATILGPQRFIAPTAALAGAAITAVCNGDPSNTGWFALLVLLAWCALCAPLVWTGALWLAVTVLFVLQATLTESDPGWLAWIAGTAFSVLGCAFGRLQHELVVELHAAQEGLAQRAQAEERNRIARELHDVIAHSLTVSLLHVSSARLALADAPEDAARALAEAERLGRAALDEVRHAVGTLHRDDAADPTAPLPGSTDVPALIESFTSAGADVRATVDADLATLPTTVGLAAYRILQEALTNAVKHAPSTRATVRLAVNDGAVQVDVDSAGPPGRGRGLGLIGMRERAEAIGGTFEAGPGGSGWRVHAELPVKGSA